MLRPRAHGRQFGRRTEGRRRRTGGRRVGAPPRLGARRGVLHGRGVRTRRRAGAVSRAAAALGPAAREVLRARGRRRPCGARVPGHERSGPGRLARQRAGAALQGFGPEPAWRRRPGRGRAAAASVVAAGAARRGGGGRRSCRRASGRSSGGGGRRRRGVRRRARRRQPGTRRASAGPGALGALLCLGRRHAHRGAAVRGRRPQDSGRHVRRRRSASARASASAGRPVSTARRAPRPGGGAPRVRCRGREPCSSCRRRLAAQRPGLRRTLVHFRPRRRRVQWATARVARPVDARARPRAPGRPPRRLAVGRCRSDARSRVDLQEALPARARRRHR
mmetsp:Transcript_11435/g.36546  ORF Transcript_11435/g.36546 Transcript_11435/m.36546 type:complete len:335 (-) Transcript_11435:148-1152(-)